MSRRPAIPDDKDLVVYDGVCGLCNGFVRFIIRHDEGGRFRFLPWQSELTADLLRHHGENPEGPMSVVLIQQIDRAEPRVLRRSRASLHIVTSFGGAWRLLSVFRVLPDFLLDLGYRLVAALRYRIAGRTETCQMPTPELRARFLDIPEA